MPSTLQLIIDAQTRGMEAFVQMQSALAAVKVEAANTGSSLDKTKTSVDSTSNSMGLLSKANIDLTTRFKDTRTQVDNVRQALVAHGVASRDAETATKGLFDQLARKGVLSDLKSAFADAGVSVRGMGSQLNVMATELVNAQQQAESSTPFFSGLGSTLSSVGDVAGTVGSYIMPVLIGSIISAALVTTPLIIAFTAWLTVTTGLAVGLAGLGATASIFLGGMGLLLGVMTALAVQTGNVNGPLKTFEATWKSVAGTLGAAAAPAVTTMLGDLDRLAPTVQSLALAWINWFNAISSPAFSIFMGLAQTFLGTTQQLTPQIQGLTNAFIAMWPQLQPLANAFAQLGAQTIIGLLTNLMRLSQWFLQTWPQAAGVAGSGFSVLGSAISGILNIGAQMVAFFVSNWPTISALARDSANAFGYFGQYLQVVWEFMQGPLHAVLVDIITHQQEFTMVLLAMLGPIIGIIAILAVLVVAFAGLIAITVQTTIWMEQLVHWFQGELPVAITTLGDYFSQLGANAHSVWSQLTNEIQYDVAAIGGFFSDLGSAAYGVESAFGSAFSAIGSSVHGAFSDVANIIVSFDKAADNLPIIGGMLNLPQSFPGFAEGGIVNRPTFGVFGEAGPEALIPLGGGPGNANALNLWAQAGQALGVHGLGAGPNMTPGTWGGQCIAKGTMIATERGQVRIEDVKVGERVWTRHGLRPVLWSGLTRPSANVLTIRTRGGRSLTLTPDHRVWVERRAHELGTRSEVMVDHPHPLPGGGCDFGDGGLWHSAGSLKDGGLSSDGIAADLARTNLATLPVDASLAHSSSVRANEQVVPGVGMASGAVSSVTLTDLHGGGFSQDGGNLSATTLVEKWPEETTEVGDFSHAAETPHPHGLLPQSAAGVTHRLNRSALEDVSERFKNVEVGGSERRSGIAPVSIVLDSYTAFSLKETDCPSEGWRYAIDLNVGDQLVVRGGDGKFGHDLVSSIAPGGQVDTYDLTVDSIHEFCASDIVSHNCVVFVESVSGTHFPVAFAAQMASYVNSPTPAPGEIFVSTIPPYGHTGIVLSGNQVIDSNWGLNELIQIHSLSDIPDIVGYISGVPMSGLPAGSTLDVSSAMSGLVSRALGGAGGLVGSIANGMLNLIISGAKSKFGAGGLGAGLGGGRSSAPSMPSAPRGGGRGAGMGNDRVEALLASIDRKLATIAGAPSVGGLAAAQRIG